MDFSHSETREMEKKSNSKKMLLYFQCAIFFVLIFFALFLLVSDPTTDNGDYYKPWSIITQWKEANFVVPEADRKPKVSMLEFYKKQDDLIWEMILKSRLEFKEQHFVGTVMKDGYHADLPSDCMWKNGKVEKSREVQKIRAEEAAKGAHNPGGMKAPAPETSKINSTTQ